MGNIEFNINQSQTIDTTSVVVSLEKDNSNFKRKSITIINTSTGGQKVSLAIGSEAGVAQGIPLNVGGHWHDSEDGGYKPTQRQITAISDLAGATIAIQERTGV